MNDDVEASGKGEQEKVEESKSIVKDNEYYSKFIMKEEKKIVPKEERKTIACLGDIDNSSISKRNASTKPLKKNDYRTYKTLIRSSVSTPHNISRKPLNARGDVKNPLAKKRQKASQRVNELLKERKKQKNTKHNKDCKTTIDTCMNLISKMKKDHNKDFIIVTNDADTKCSYIKSYRPMQKKTLERTRNLQSGSTNSPLNDKPLIQNCNIPLYS